MTTLRLYITEAWPDEPACEWVLLGNNGLAEAGGTSPPADWPAAKRTELVLAGPQTIYLRLSLPKGSRRPSARQIAYGLEDQLIRDPDKQHFTLARQEGENADVIVIDRDRLAQIVAKLSELGRPPTRIVSEMEVAEAPVHGAWSVMRRAQHAILQGAGPLPTCVDNTDSAPPSALLTYLAHARTQEQMPAYLVVRNSPGLVAIDTESWSAQLGLPVELGDDYEWHRIDDRTCNLLHGDFRSTNSESGSLKAVRSAIYVFFAVLVCSVIGNVIAIMAQRKEFANTRQAIQATVRSALPGQPLIDPVSQISASLKEARHAHGQLAENDFLSMLAGLGDGIAENAAASLKSLRYAEGKLSVSFTGDPGLPQTVAAHLGSRGYSVTVADTGEIFITREAKR